MGGGVGRVPDRDRRKELQGVVFRERSMWDSELGVGRTALLSKWKEGAMDRYRNS